VSTPDIRVLIVGCGVAARTHSRDLRRVGRVQLSYASRDAARAESFRREFNGVESFGSYEDAMSADVDLVVVTTPTSAHLDLAVAALRSDKDVVVEKPAFMRSVDAECVGKFAAKVGRRVFVAENYAYKAITSRIRSLVERGDLGDVRFVTINATKRQSAHGWRSDPSIAGGNAMFEGGVHWVSFACSLGLDVASARGYQTAGPSSSLVVLTYTNGAVGTVAYSWELAAPFGGLRMSKIQGTLGAITFESNGLVSFGTGRARSLSIAPAGDPLGRRAMWRDFLHAFRTGEAPRFTLGMAQRDLMILEAAGM
jgi:UDP-N-acetylglucosamine 3-dehydrogenase